MTLNEITQEIISGVEKYDRFKNPKMEGTGPNGKVMAHDTVDQRLVAPVASTSTIWFSGIIVR